MPHEGRLTRLTEGPQALYEDLRLDRLGPHVRLEQERIACHWVRHQLGSLAG